MNAPEVWAYVALGSNLGDPRKNILQAFDRFAGFSREPIRHSSLWRSSPVDCPPGSPDFINAVAGMQPFPEETPESLIAKLQALEREFGRQPKKVLNESRPLDLDLIAFGMETRSTPGLTLPHPRAVVRKFVLEPLCEIAPHLILPGQAHPISVLLAQLGSTEKIERAE